MKSAGHVSLNVNPPRFSVETANQSPSNRSHSPAPCSRRDVASLILAIPRPTRIRGQNRQTGPMSITPKFSSNSAPPARTRKNPISTWPLNDVRASMSNPPLFVGTHTNIRGLPGLSDSRIGKRRVSLGGGGAPLPERPPESPLPEIPPDRCNLSTHPAVDLRGGIA